MTAGHRTSPILSIKALGLLKRTTHRREHLMIPAQNSSPQSYFLPGKPPFDTVSAQQGHTPPTKQGHPLSQQQRRLPRDLSLPKPSTNTKGLTRGHDPPNASPPRQPALFTPRPSNACQPTDVGQLCPSGGPLSCPQAPPTCRSSRQLLLSKTTAGSPICLGERTTSQAAHSSIRTS